MKKFLVLCSFAFHINSYCVEDIQRLFDMAKHSFEQRNAQEAIRRFEGILLVDKNNIMAHYYLATIHYYQYNYCNALFHYKKCHELAPEEHRITFQYALALDKCGKFEEAQMLLETLRTKKYDPDQLNGILIHFYLRNKDWSNIAKIIDISSFPAHNEILWGKKIYIKHAPDHGFGDIIQFMKLTQIFKDRGAYVTVEAPERLKPLFSTCCPYIDDVITYGDKPKDCDYTISQSIGGMILYTKSFINYLKEAPPYLYADKKLIKFWKPKFENNSTFNIGICWQSTRVRNFFSGQEISGNRGIALTMFNEIAQIPNVRLYSLQKGFGQEQLDHIDFEVKAFENFDTSHGSFMDTAAIMQHLDLVITVDTSMAHVAGALGTPVWTLLPCDSDYRWFKKDADTPWYPTMRLFRLGQPGQWQELMKEVKEALKEIC